MSGTVWILGAGFSKSLGGPLLPDLLSTASMARISAAYPKTDSRFTKLRGEAVNEVMHLYCIGGPEGQAVGRRWEDAEEFLDALDTAARSEIGSQARVYLNSITGAKGVDPNELAIAARRLVAAECSLFVEKATVRTEVWNPYQRWAELLGPSDTVITFNYDLVVERAMDIAGQLSGLQVVLPDAELDENRVALLKLHGSVDWQRIGKVYTRQDPTWAMISPDEQFVIATPGPRKLTESLNLGWLWQKAKTRLKTATAIVFVGYRFPPSDSYSRRELLSALAMHNESKTLSIHTVLGQNTGDPATLRLVGLLRHAGATWDKRRHAREPKGEGLAALQAAMDAHKQQKALSIHPLFAEDFLDLFHPEDLAMLDGRDF